MTAMTPAAGLRLPDTTDRARPATPRHRSDRRTAGAWFKETPHALHAAIRYVVTGSTEEPQR